MTLCRTIRISSILYGSEIENELICLGIKNIINMWKILSEYTKADPKQYYDVFAFDKDEVVADVGCFDCESILQYFNYANKVYKKIYSFEPEPHQYEHCKEIIEKGGYRGSRAGGIKGMCRNN